MQRSLLDELKGFQGREDELRKITRYHIYTPMFYRTNDFTHAGRVQKIVRSLGPVVSSRIVNFDLHQAEAMALVHDDAELVVGDVQAGNKAKMSAEQIAQLEEREREAIGLLSQRFPPTLGGYVYRDLLLAAIERKSPEAQLVQFADKFDAFGEALHEVTAGNLRFATNVTTEFGLIGTPPMFYTEYFGRFVAKYPSLAFLTEGPDKALDLEACLSMDWKALAAKGSPHTRDSLQLLTGLQPYELWKQILLRNASEEELGNLTLRVE